MTSGWNVTKIRRHLRWLIESGPKALIEEDDLDLRQRLANAVERRKYQRTNPQAGPATAVWVLGAQRSGTNMAMRGLAKHGGVRVYNENHRRAFSGFELASIATVQGLIAACPQPIVAFKPLCDSDRAVELLEQVGPGSRALWIHRDVDARARSAVAKFGDANLNMMRSIVAGDEKDRWWGRSVDEPTRAAIAAADPATMSAHDAAAMFWWMRNKLVFDHELDARDDVHLVKYEELLADPTGSMREICSHIGLAFEPRMVDHFEPYRSTNKPLDLAEKVRGLCDDLGEKLAAL